MVGKFRYRFRNDTVWTADTGINKHIIISPGTVSDLNHNFLSSPLWFSIFGGRDAHIHSDNVSSVLSSPLYHVKANVLPL